MKTLALIGLIIFGCVGFNDVEQPNVASLDNVEVVNLTHKMTRAELDAWAESARH